MRGPITGGGMKIKAVLEQLLNLNIREEQSIKVARQTREREREKIEDTNRK